MSLPRFLASRFFQSSSNKPGASTPAIRIATLGIAVGLAVMLITQSVVSGFQHEVSRKVEGMASHIEIMDLRSLGSPENFPIHATPGFLKAIDSVPAVAHVQRIATKMGILKTEDDFLAINLKGIGPDYDTTFLHSAITEGRLPHDNEILISARQAKALQLKTADKVFAYFFEDDIHTRRYTISGIYDTHMTLFDQGTVFAPFNAVATLNPWGTDNPDACCCIEVRLQDIKQIPQAQPPLQQIAQHHTAKAAQAVSVEEHYPQVFSWLNLLDVNMMLILILMVAVAGITMVSGLLILILERTQTIGVLKALGATNRQVRHTFLHFAALIIVRGMAWGNIAALALILAQQQWGLIHLNPDTYYVDTVPAELHLLPFIIINLATLALTLITLILPSHIVSRIQPAKAIRFE